MLKVIFTPKRSSLLVSVLNSTPRMRHSRLPFSQPRLCGASDAPHKWALNNEAILRLSGRTALRETDEGWKPMMKGGQSACYSQTGGSWDKIWK